MPSYDVNESIKVWPKTDNFISRGKKDYEYDPEVWGRWNEQAINHPLPIDMPTYSVSDEVNAWPNYTNGTNTNNFMAKGKKDWEYNGFDWGQWNEQAINNHPEPVDMPEYNVSNATNAWPNYTNSSKNASKPSNFLAKPIDGYKYNNDDWNQWHDQAIWFRDSTSEELRPFNGGSKIPANRVQVAKKWGDENGGGVNRWDYWSEIAKGDTTAEAFHQAAAHPALKAN
jgi:hypothetical protein